jgi:hypothetical protein
MFDHCDELAQPLVQLRQYKAMKRGACVEQPDSRRSVPGRIWIVTLELHGCAVDKAKSLMLNVCRSSSSGRQPHLLLLHTD